jgi:hypothetical protein
MVIVGLYGSSCGATSSSPTTAGYPFTGSFKEDWRSTAMVFLTPLKRSVAAGTERRLIVIRSLSIFSTSGQSLNWQAGE